MEKLVWESAEKTWKIRIYFWLVRMVIWNVCLAKPAWFLSCSFLDKVPDK